MAQETLALSLTLTHGATHTSPPTFNSHLYSPYPFIDHVDHYQHLQHGDHGVVAILCRSSDREVTYAAPALSALETLEATGGSLSVDDSNHHTRLVNVRRTASVPVTTMAGAWPTANAEALSIPVEGATPTPQASTPSTQPPNPSELEPILAVVLANIASTYSSLGAALTSIAFEVQSMRTAPAPADDGPSASVDDSPLSAGARPAKAAPNSATEGESIPASIASPEPFQAKISNLQATLERFEAALHLAVGQNTRNGQASTVELAAAVSTMRATQSEMAATLAAHTAAIAALVGHCKSTHKAEALASLINTEAQGPDMLSPQTQREAALMLKVDTLQLRLERERVSHEQTRKAANKPRPRVQARDFPPTGRSTPSMSQSAALSGGPSQQQVPSEPIKTPMQEILEGINNSMAILARTVEGSQQDQGSVAPRRNHRVSITKFKGEEHEEVDTFLFQVDQALADDKAIKGAHAKIRFAGKHLLDRAFRWFRAQYEYEHAFAVESEDGEFVVSYNEFKKQFAAAFRNTKATAKDRQRWLNSQAHRYTYTQSWEHHLTEFNRLRATYGKSEDAESVITKLWATLPAKEQAEIDPEDFDDFKEFADRVTRRLKLHERIWLAEQERRGFTRATPRRQPPPA